MELDDRLTLASAEGIDLDLTLAGIGSRGAAVLVDLALQGLLLILVAAVSANLGSLGLALAAIAGFAILLGYPTLAEAFASGQTVGKRLLGIAVVADDGTPARFGGCVVRNVVRLVDAVPGVYFVGCLAVLLTARSQRLGDLAAGTVVVHVASRRVLKHAPLTPQWGPSTGSLPADAAGWDVSAVTAEEVAAVRSFLARRGDLGPSARFDLARTLAFQLLPKVAGVPLEGGPEDFLERVVAAKSAR